MIPTEEKKRAMLLTCLRALEKEPGVKIVNRDAVIRSITNGIDAGLDLLIGIDSIAKQKIASLSRKVAPGTKEWDDLYDKYLYEERKKRGL